MRTLARQRDRTEIIRRLRALDPQSVARWGRMSPHQMVCHLADSFRMAMGQKSVSHDTSLLKQTILKWVVLYAPLRWPAGILTRPEIDQTLGGTKPVAFASDLGRLEELMELATGPTRRLDGRWHPLFGRMSDAAWLRWAYLHMDHHLRQFGA